MTSKGCELFQILKDDAVRVLHSICRQIWKTQQWPQDWKRSVFIPIPKKGNAKECSNYRTIVLISHISKFSSVQSLSHVWLCVTPRTSARQDSLSTTNSQSLLKLMAIDSVMPSNHLISVVPISSCIQSFLASGSFHMSQLFTSGGQSIGVSASASVIPVNIQDWFLLGWTGWISLQSKGLSRVISNTTIQKHQFFGGQLSL